MKTSDLSANAANADLTIVAIVGVYLYTCIFCIYSDMLIKLAKSKKQTIAKSKPLYKNYFNSCKPLKTTEWR